MQSFSEFLNETSNTRLKDLIDRNTVVDEMSIHRVFGKTFTSSEFAAAKKYVLGRSQKIKNVRFVKQAVINFVEGLTKQIKKEYKSEEERKSIIEESKNLSYVNGETKLN